MVFHSLMVFHSVMVLCDQLPMQSAAVKKGDVEQLWQALAEP
jgi:hypothetical protein